MELDVKPYLKYYIGQQFRMKITNPLSEHECTGDMEFNYNALCASFSKKDKINPLLILRKRSSITEEEAIELGLMRFGKDISRTEWIKDIPRLISEGANQSTKEFHYLISKGLWLFGDEYFEQGLIIEKK